MNEFFELESTAWSSVYLDIHSGNKNLLRWSFRIDIFENDFFELGSIIDLDTWTLVPGRRIRCAEFIETWHWKQLVRVKIAGSKNYSNFIQSIINILRTRSGKKNSIFDFVRSEDKRSSWSTISTSREARPKIGQISSDRPRYALVPCSLRRRRIGLLLIRIHFWQIFPKKTDFLRWPRPMIDCPPEFRSIPDFVRSEAEQSRWITYLR